MDIFNWIITSLCIYHCIATAEASIDFDIIEIQTGCDGIVGSGMIYDKCGRCGGDDTACHIRNGVFRDQLLSNTLHKIVTIPHGATRINITELSNSRSWLALRSASGDHPYYINGKMKQGIPDRVGTYTAAGTSWMYKRPLLTNDGESIMAEGPTNEDVEVMIWHQRENPGIRYEFVEPEANDQPSASVIFGGSRIVERPPTRRVSPSDTTNIVRKPAIYRQPGGGRNAGWSSRQRGNRQRQRQELTRNRGGVSRPSGQQPVYLDNTRRVAPPSINRIQNEQPVADVTSERVQLPNVTDAQGNLLVGMWVKKGYTQCNKQCGGGYKFPIYRCQSSTERATSKDLPDHQCVDDKPKPKPKRCNKVPCAPRYVVGEWSECSATCGIGRKTRLVTCRQLHQGTKTVRSVPHKKCKHQKRPAQVERCMVVQCPVRWKPVGTWSECSAKCGDGIQTLSTICVSKEGNTLPNSECIAYTKLKQNSFQRKCNMGACSSHWFMTDWGECSADCDSGLMKRNVVCLNQTDESSSVECRDEDKPAQVKTCVQPTCQPKYIWFTSGWGECSARCGDGFNTRLVLCLQIDPAGAPSIPTDPQLCDAATKPAEKQVCTAPACKGTWHFTQWSGCSVTCGRGTRKRGVNCFGASGENSTTCNIEDKPPTIEDCTAQKCPVITAAPESTCADRLPRCRVVVRAKLCGYRYYRQKCCATCASVKNRANIIRS